MSRSAGSVRAFPWGGVVVWGVWGAVLLGALLYAHAYSSPVPYYDDWILVPYLTGNEAVTPGWFWSQHEEHRIPLPKLVWLGLARATGGDFRAGVFVSILATAGLAALLIRVARSLRGYTSWSDAFFPLALFHWGGADSFLLWSFLVQLVSSTVLAGIFLAVVVRSPSQLTLRRGLLAGICLVLLPLCGANGVVLAPALALWLAYAGVRQWSAPGSAGRATGPLAVACAGLALLLVALTFIDRHRGSSPPNSSQWDVLRTSLQFASMSLGEQAYRFWPWTGLGILVCLVGTLGVLLVYWWQQPLDRLRTLGLLAFLVAGGALALAVGWDRAGFGWRAGFQERYMILAAPLLYGVYLTWGVAGGRRGRLVQMALCACLLLLLPGNLKAGFKSARRQRQLTETAEQDLAAGLPPFAVSRRNALALFPEDFPQREEFLTDLLEQLRRARFRAFRDLAPDPAFRTVAVPVPAADRRTESPLTVTLPSSQWVYLIRLTFTEARPGEKPQTVQVAWKTRTGEVYPDTPRGRLIVEPAAEDQPRPTALAAWVDEAIVEFRITCTDSRLLAHLADITLYVPAKAPAVTSTR